MRTDLLLASRFLREAPMQTLLLVLGATVGTTVVFFITALIAAVERTMVEQTLDVMPHVLVKREDARATPAPAPDGAVTIRQDHAPPQRIRSISGWSSLVAAFERQDGVVAVSPIASGPAIVTRGRASRAVSLTGVDPGRFARVISIRGRVRSGRYALDGNDTLIGVELARELGVRVGDRVRVTGAGDAVMSFFVAGIFDMGNLDVNRRWMLVSLRSAQTLHALPGGVTSIELRLADVWQADRVADLVHARTGLTSESWMRTSAQLMIAIQSQRGATLMIRVCIMLAVALGIASVLVVSVVQKGRQIGILRAMGTSRGTVVRVFVLQGGLVGVLGAALGCGAGTLLAFASQRTNVAADGTPMYPIELPVSLYAMAAVITIGAGVVAALLPARRAAALDPAVAIRHD